MTDLDIAKKDCVELENKLKEVYTSNSWEQVLDFLDNINFYGPSDFDSFIKRQMPNKDTSIILGFDRELCNSMFSSEFRLYNLYDFLSYCLECSGIDKIVFYLSTTREYYSTPLSNLIVMYDLLNYVPELRNIVYKEYVPSNRLLGNSKIKEDNLIRSTLRACKEFNNITKAYLLTYSFDTNVVTIAIDVSDQDKLNDEEKIKLSTSFVNKVGLYYGSNMTNVCICRLLKTDGTLESQIDKFTPCYVKVEENKEEINEENR